jgi:predicted O-linked N-acetylglucosamine transferase (SPINDLY family)
MQPNFLPHVNQMVSQRSEKSRLSIITCSVDHAKFTAFETNVRNTFGNGVQLIRIADARSLSEGYNRGIARAEGDILVFCHDDIEFLSCDTAALIREDLLTRDIAGVAGASRLYEGKWILAGHPHVHGQVAHLAEDRKRYELTVYGQNTENVLVDGIQALDGLFFAVKRHVLDQVQFEEYTFTGFHLYDLDFTYSAFLRGFRLAVDYRIHVLHTSAGRYDEVWKADFFRFNRKHARHLPKRQGPVPVCRIHGITVDGKEDLIRQMAEISGQDPQDAYEQARALYGRGDLSASLAAFKRAVRLSPDSAAAHHDMGAVLVRMGRPEDALRCFQNAVNEMPRMAQAWFNGANCLVLLNRLGEAVNWYQTALGLSQDSGDIHYNLANTYKRMEQYDAALEHYRRALEADPSLSPALINMGTLFLRKSRHQSALEAFQKACEADPDNALAVYNSAWTLKKMGREDEALVRVRHALELQPDYPDALALLVPLLQQMCDWPALKQAEARLEKLTRTQLAAGQRPSESPFLSFTRTPDPRHNLAVARAWANHLVTDPAADPATDPATDPIDQSPQFNFLPRRQGQKKITIGYLSEQFRNAATAHLTAAMFRNHDRNRFRIIAYSWGEDDGSAYRRNIMRDVDQFTDIRHLTDGQAARRIHTDQVDILVDLMGWMHGHRMAILAARPAPVQVNYLGYPGTSGAPFMDYIIADKVVIPPEHHPFYSERVVTLPHSYQVTDPHPSCHQDLIRREEYGLPREGVVFCSFNTDYKIEETTFNGWMDILKAAPGSVLWLITRSTTTQDNLRHAACTQGLDPLRLVFAPPLSKDRHLARLKLADLALDTLTVNGHTTTSDTLWAGVPVITVMGSHFASRVAASLLDAMGLNELIAPDLETYKRMAVDLALNMERLRRLKDKVAAARTTQPLFDVDGFVRSLEQAYEIMWDKYLQNRPLETFNVV